MLKKTIFIFLTVCICSGPIFGETARTDYRLDNEFFRRGLIDRGFDDWLKLYDQQHPPSTDLDLLAQQIGQAWLDYRRQTDTDKRSQALEKLLKLELDRVDSYPDHPLSANWRVRYASDLLNEKLRSQTFIHLLGLDLPEEYRKPFGNTLIEIETQLDKAKKFLNTSMASFEHMDNAKLAQTNRQGLPELYQAANFQSDYLRAWCWYHRARMLVQGRPEQVKVLYPLVDLLEKMNNGNAESGSGSLKLLGASVSRLLGKYPQSQELLTQASKSLPASYALFADIEQILLALANNQPERALKLVATVRSRSTGGVLKQEMVDMSLFLLEGQARLRLLPAEEQAQAGRRNEIWKQLTILLIAKPELRVFAFPKLLELTENCGQDSMSDIELYAHAERSVSLKKIPLAQTELQDLLSRKEIPGELKLSAAAFLAKTYEQQGRFADAYTSLQTALSMSGNQQAEFMAEESARLAWLAYRAAPNEKQRTIFIESASRLLSQFPTHGSADQFKLLMADDFSQSGEFNQAFQWIQQVPAGSALYLQAKAAKVLTYSRQYKRDIQSTADYSTKPGSAAQRLADQIDEACKEMLVIASARQKDPEKIETWNLTNDQVQLISGALLATVNVLADPALGRAKYAEEMLARYKPILGKYEKTSKSAIATRILTLTQTASAANLLEATVLARQLVESGELPASQTASAVIQVLEAVHKSELSKQANPIGEGDDLAKAGYTVVESVDGKLKVDRLPESLKERLAEFLVIASVDAGKYSEAQKRIERFSKLKEAFADFDLAKARVELWKKKYFEAASLSMPMLQSLSPSDIRYWHALIINLNAHLALKSDPSQVASAIIARQQEYPDLGNAATQKELLKTLKTANGLIKPGK